MQTDVAAVQADATTTHADAVTAQPSARSRRHLIAYRNNASIKQRLLAAQVAIEGVLADMALQDALAPYGYDLPRIMQGKALRDQAQALVQQQGARTNAVILQRYTALYQTSGGFRLTERP